jgi:hypothetical protein
LALWGPAAVLAVRRFWPEPAASVALRRPAAILAFSRPAAAAIVAAWRPAAVVAAWRAGPGSAVGLAARRSAALSRSWLQLRLWSPAAAVL